jgi:hypothetical protein
MCMKKKSRSHAETPKSRLENCHQHPSTADNEAGEKERLKPGEAREETRAIADTTYQGRC